MVSFSPNAFTYNYIIILITAVYIIYLARFAITVTPQNVQLVGRSLTLDCTITEAMSGNNGLLEIVWTSNNRTLRTTSSTPTTSGSSLVYTDSYTISQLNTSDQDRVIQCIANRTSFNTSITDSGSITLNVTGKFERV